MEEGSTPRTWAARDVVKGDHPDKIVELVKAPGGCGCSLELFSRRRRSTSADARESAVVGKGRPHCGHKGASAARSAAADISVDIEEGRGLRATDLAAKVRRGRTSVI